MSSGKSSYGSLQVELRYGTPKHDRIKQMIIDRKMFSNQKMKDFHKKWNDTDDTFRAYVPETESTATKRLNKKAGKYDYITLEVPYSYAVALTAHTYLSSVFLGRNPIYQFTARHGETQDAVMAVEAIMDYQLYTGGHLPSLFNWIFDAVKYGVGFIGDYWCEQYSTVSTIQEEPVSILGFDVPNKTRKVKSTAKIRGYAGNKLYNVSVYDAFPDPRVPIVNFQDGEFFGRNVKVGMHELIEGQAAGRFFNVERVAKMKQASTDPHAGEPSSNLELPFMNNEAAYRGPSFVTLTEMTIRLIPRDWGLGSSNSVEKWVFTIADNEVVVGAQPLGLYHDKFPFAIMEYGLGTDEFIKPSMIEVMQPLSDALSWLFNSHMYGVRKSLNDVRIADPSRVVLKDMMEPYGGSIIRLKPNAYGTDARMAIHQLAVGDVTGTHLRDMQVVEGMIQRALGVVDNLMGQSDSTQSGDRKTATEVRSSVGFATSRLKTIAEYNSAVGMSQLAQMMLMNTQQLYDDEKKFRIAGSLMETAPAFLKQNLTPESISGFFDYVPVDGTMPVDRFAQAQFWKELVIQMAGNPQLAMQWDINGIIAHTMSLQGERNINRFRVNVQPNQAIAAGASAGNIVPIAGAGGSRVGNAAGGGVQGSGTPGGVI